MQPFREVQRFRQPWLWAMVAISSLVPIVVLSGVLLTQVSSGRPVGNNPMSTPALARSPATRRAPIVSGDRGVQLVLRDGRRILIGSQRADELDAALGAS